MSRSILLATLPNLGVPHFLDSPIAHAAQLTSKRLVIVLFSRHFNGGSNHKSPLPCIGRTKCWDAVQSILTFTYVQATKVAWEMDNILLEVDVLLKGLNEDLEPNLGDGMDVCYRISGDSIAVPLPGSISSLPQSYIPVSGPFDLAPTTITPSCTPSPASSGTPPSFPNTALGGTFDHLHAGHKILLSMAAWITHSKLIVGLTSDALLVSKSYASVLESFSTRSARVSSFLKFFKPGLTIDIQPINDVYGPTGWDPDIQALVVSKETLSGGEKIKAWRKEKNLPELKTFLIDVVSATSANLEHEDVEWLKENKLSSTEVRRWIMAQQKEKNGAEELENDRNQVGKELTEVFKHDVTVI